MNRRFVPTTVHGAVDYVTAPALIAAPELLRLNGARGSALSPRAAGVAGAIAAALTDYELGLRRIIPMRVHVGFDAVAGTALALAPWLSGSARRGTRHWLPHALAGATEVALAFTTKTERRVTGLRRALVPGRRLADAFADLPRSQRIAFVAIPAAAAVGLAYVGRRRVLALAGELIEQVGDVIEDVGDAVEDATDYVEDLTDDAADALKGRSERD